MGWIGPAISLVGGLLGGGSKKSGGSSTPAPTMTPDQKEMSGFLKPYLKDWMKNPPKLTGGPYQHTRISFGDDFQYNPRGGGGSVHGVGPSTNNDPRYPSGFRGDPAFNQRNPSNTPAHGVNREVSDQEKQSLINKAMAQNSMNGASGGMWGPGVGANLARFTSGTLDDKYNAAKKMLGGFGSSSGEYTDFAGRKEAMVRVPVNNWYDEQKVINSGGTVSGGYGLIPNPGYSAPAADSDGSKDDPLHKWDTGNNMIGSGRGPRNGTGPGSIQLPNMPNLLDRFGNGGEGYDSPDFLSMFGPGEGRYNMPEHPEQVDTYDPGLVGRKAANSRLPGASDLEGRYSGFGAADTFSSGGNTYGKEGGYQEINPDQKFGDYSNNLEGDVEGRIRRDMDREVSNGYSPEYLNLLKEQGMDPLNDAYREAMDRAEGYHNRMGLHGSGFEQNDMFGTQNGSVTRNYLDRAKELNRDIAIRGAEANREDLYRNASLQDRARDAGFSLSGRQGNDQFRRNSADYGVMRDNDQSRMGWGRFRQGQRQYDDSSKRDDWQSNLRRDQWLSSLGSEDWRNKFSLGNQQNADDKYWNEFAQGQKRYDDLTARSDWNDSLREGQWMQNMAQNRWNNESDQRDWLSGLAQSDWSNAVGMGQWLANRDDKLSDANTDLGLNLQEKNIGYQTDMADRIQKYIYGLNGAASNANRNYWNQRNADRMDANDNANAWGTIARGIGDYFSDRRSSRNNSGGGGGMTSAAMYGASSGGRY